jgi:hypothetical protein
VQLEKETTPKDDTSFESQIPISYKWSVDTFRPSVTAINDKFILIANAASSSGENNFSESLTPTFS